MEMTLLSCSELAPRAETQQLGQKSLSTFFAVDFVSHRFFALLLEKIKVKSKSHKLNELESIFRSIT